jgi:thiol-disulfide isomerase/thioredoxin
MVLWRINQGYDARMDDCFGRLLQVGSKPDEYLSKVERTARASEWKISLDSYIPDQTMVEKLARVKQKSTVVCFSAYWCKDCQKRVPELAITLRKAKNGGLVLLLIDYDQNKKLAEEMGVRAIPTFIVFGAKETEAGRIVENPSPPFKSIGEELLAMITSK